MTDLMTAEQVAALLSISEDQVKRRTKSERWPCVRFGAKTIRYSALHVEQIVAMHETTSEPRAVGLAGQTSRSRRRSA